MKVIRNGLFVLFILAGQNTRANSDVLAASTYDSCAGIDVTTTNGIRIWSGGIYSGSCYTATITSGDSITLNVHTSHCSLMDLKIYHDGDLIHSYPGSFYTYPYRFLPGPGTYVVSAVHSNGRMDLTFYMVLNPLSVSEADLEKSLFSIIPNPATKEFSILSSDEEITKLVIYSQTGQEMERIFINAKKADIPVSNYPSGIYYIHVATLSKKIIIRKVVVL